MGIKLKCLIYASQACLYGVLFLVMSYQVCLFLSMALSDPLATAVESVPLNDSAFQHLTVCSDNWYNAKDAEQLEGNFPIGYLEGEQFKKINISLTQERFDEVNGKWKSETRDFDDFVQKIRPLYHTPGVLNRTKMEPLYLDGTVVCQRLPHWVRYMPYEVGRGSGKEISEVFRFMLPQRLKRTVHMTLYQTDSVQYLQREDYTTMEYPDNPKSTFHNFDVDATKHSYLSTKENPCQKEPENTVHPLGYLQAKCNIDCTLEAHAYTFNCTPILHHGKRGIWSWPLCHFHNTLRNEDEAFASRPRDKPINRKMFNTLRNKCIEREECKKKRYCTEWSLEVRQTEYTVELKQKNTREKTIQLLKKKSPSVHKVHVSFKPRVTAVREYRIYTREAIVSSIGGLGGFWVGLSVFGMVPPMLACLLRCCPTRDKECDRDREATRDDGEKEDQDDYDDGV